jgi:1-phosphofructokinase family hexose kinase
MILTVTLNSALDWVTFIDEFCPTTVIRADKVVESIAGKGFDTSLALRSLGVPSLALGLVAGKNGKHLEQMLVDAGIEVALVWVDGETRIANVIVEQKLHRHTHIMTWGCTVSARSAQEFEDLFASNLARASWAILAGSMSDGLPPDYMKRLIETAHRAGVSTLIDCRGEPFQLALQARPTISKMNQAEYYQTFGGKFNTMMELRLEADKVRQRDGLDSLVITCGEEGILAVTPQGAYMAISPMQQAVNAAGAGDAVSGVLAWRLEQGDPWSEALRWAAAAGAATVLTEGTAESHPEDVERILRETVVTAF